MHERRFSHEKGSLYQAPFGGDQQRASMLREAGGECSPRLYIYEK